MTDEQATPCPPKARLPLLAIKIDRISAWVLLIVIIFYGITGYGMTKGIIDRQLASILHLSWLGIIGLTAFIIHTSWAIHLFFRRKGIWNIYTRILLILFYVGLALFFGYLHFFYDASQESKTQSSSTSEPISNSMLIPDKVFTVSTLVSFNGLNGQPAYVAVDGIVYDMSPVFRSGKHHGYSAGRDLSSAFHNEHPDSFLNGYQIVGTYR